MINQAENIEPGDLLLLTIAEKYQHELGDHKIGIATKIEFDEYQLHRKLVHVKWLREENMYPSNTVWPEQNILNDVPGRLFQFKVIR